MKGKQRLQATADRFCPYQNLAQTPPMSINMLATVSRTQMVATSDTVKLNIKKAGGINIPATITPADEKRKNLQSYRQWRRSHPSADDFQIGSQHN